LLGEGRLEEALGETLQAAALAPDHAEIATAAGAICHHLGKFDEAIAWYDRALSSDPDHADGHFNRALARLTLGRLEEGWSGFEWRFKRPRAPAMRHAAEAPLWAGEDLSGSTILLHAEQGIGDTLQFSRYVKIAARSAGAVLLEVEAELVELMSSLDPTVTVIARGAPLPPFDVHAPIPSLPGLFGTRLSGIPADIPYLRADAAGIARWRDRLDGLNGLKIGLVWAGNPRFALDRLRSPRLPVLLPLLAVEGATFIGLQLGDGRQDLAMGTPANLLDLGAEISSFADTAAIMANLDLVISSCTAPAHLAGALGVPAWCCCPMSRIGAGYATAPTAPGIRLCGCSGRSGRATGRPSSRKYAKNCRSALQDGAEQRRSERPAGVVHHFAITETLLDRMAGGLRLLGIRERAGLEPVIEPAALGHLEFRHDRLEAAEGVLQSGGDLFPTLRRLLWMPVGGEVDTDAGRRPGRRYGRLFRCG
jgi:hypothetical protein